MLYYGFSTNLSDIFTRKLNSDPTPEVINSMYQEILALEYISLNDEQHDMKKHIDWLESLPLNCGTQIFNPELFKFIGHKYDDAIKQDIVANIEKQLDILKNRVREIIVLYDKKIQMLINAKNFIDEFFVQLTPLDRDMHYINSLKSHTVTLNTISFRYDTCYRIFGSPLPTTIAYHELDTYFSAYQELLNPVKCSVVCTFMASENDKVSRFLISIFTQINTDLPGLIDKFFSNI